jgi:hypothetical protein
MGGVHLCSRTSCTLLVWRFLPEGSHDAASSPTGLASSRLAARSATLRQRITSSCREVMPARRLGVEPSEVGFGDQPVPGTRRSIFSCLSAYGADRWLRSLPETRGASCAFTP